MFGQTNLKVTYNHYCTAKHFVNKSIKSINKLGFDYKKINSIKIL